jgi:hypothetical protein
MGAALALGLAVLPFAVIGALDDVVYANVFYNWEYATRATLNLAALGRSAGPVILVAGPFFLAAGLGTLLLLRTRRQPEASLLLAWAAGCLLSFILPGRLSYHHLIVGFPALALLAGYALVRVWACWDWPAVRAWTL